MGSDKCLFDADLHNGIKKKIGILFATILQKYGSQ